MTLRVATVLSARDWESRLVSEAQTSARIRLVLRAYQPEDITAAADELDVVVAGGETSWVTPAVVATWRRIGLRVVGVRPVGDEPARELFLIGGADEVLSDDLPPDQMVRAIQLLKPRATTTTAEAAHPIVVVTGPPGAPGRTETAAALAWNWSRERRTLLADLHLDAPALAVRLGLPARPDLTDAADEARSNGIISDASVRGFGPMRVLVGSHRPGERRLRQAMAEDVLEAAAARYEVVVADTGPPQPDVNDRIIKRADHAVVVAEASPLGLVRAATLLTEWTGPTPALVLNMVAGATEDLIAAARRWTGLEPAAVITHRRAVRMASVRAVKPERSFRRSLERIRVPA